MSWKLRFVLASVGILLLQGVASAGIVGHYTFDDADVAGFTLLDTSGNSLDGTINNDGSATVGVTTGQLGQIGQAFNFTSPGFVDLTANLLSYRGLPQGTISAWINRPMAGGANAIFSVSDSSEGSTEARFMYENGIFWGVRGGGNGGTTDKTVVPTNEWHHVAVTVDGTQTARIFVDGVEESSTCCISFLDGFGDDNSDADSVFIAANNDSGGGDPNQWYFEGLLDDLQIYDIPLPGNNINDIYQAGLAGNSLVIEGIAEATIDRDNGQLSLANNGSPLTITGYSFRSGGGALDPANWLSIAENYDVDHPGPDQVDPNDDWVELTDPIVRTDLSEFEPDGDGAVISNGQTIDFGTGAWLKNPDEDVVLQLLLDDGNVSAVPVNFVNGPNDAPYEFGDLDFDGDFDTDDFFNVFVPGFGADTSALAGAELYQAGDFNADGIVDEFDFLIYNAAFLAANPGAPGLVIPEPGGLAMLMLAGLMGGAVCRASRRRPVGLALAAVLIAGAAVTSESSADLVLHMDPNVLGTMFSDGGSGGGNTPVTGIGDPVGFMSDARSPTPGAPLDGFIDSENTGPPFVGGHPSGFILDFFGGDKLLTTDGDRNNQDGFGTQLDTNTMTMIVVGQVNAGGVGPQYLFDLRDDAGNPGGTTANANNGFGLYFDHDTGLLEGVAKQAVTVSNPAVAPGEYFVATYAWDGAAGSASLNVLTAGGGSTTVTGSADTAAVDPDRFRIGARAQNDQSWVGTMGDFLLYNDALDHSDVAMQLAEDYFNLPGPSLDVNVTTGLVTLKNDSTVARDIDLYRIRSEGNSLNTTGWLSMDDQDFDSGAWTELGVASNKVSEGAFGGSSDLGPGFSLSLGSLYDVGMDAQDLVFDYHIVGTSTTLLVEGEVEYIESTVDGDFNMDDKWDCVDIDALTAAIAGMSSDLSFDMNGDGVIDIGDLTDTGTGWLAVGGARNPDQTGGNAFIQGDGNLDGVVDVSDFNIFNNNKFTTNSAWCSGDYNADGVVDVSDFNIFNNNKFTSSMGGASVVPEPSTGMLCGLVVLSLIGLRARLFRCGAAAVVIICVVSLAFPSAPGWAGVTNDRDYQLGDDSFEGADIGQIAGSGNANGTTFDSAGTPGAGDLQDLARSSGSPRYVGVSDRPGADANDLGVSFDPATQDFLSTPISMNAPSEMWDNTSFFPLGFPHNYEGIFAHGIQLWAKPNSATEDVRQDLVIDTAEHGVFITDQNSWGLVFDNASIDSGVPVAFDQWTHLMQLGGFVDPTGGGSRVGGVLYADGVAVAAQSSTYDSDDSALSLGANQDGSGNFYHGILDDVRLFLWGDNTGQDNGGAGPFGQNWGALNLAEDNDWIAMELADRGVTNPADVNLDGEVSGDGNGPAATDDVTAFVDGWLFERLVNRVQVGDWISRQNGDLNYDGITDLYDAHILHEGLVAATGVGLDYNLLVPEPGAALLGLLGFLTSLTAVRHRGQASWKLD